MEGAMKWLMTFFLISCATPPSVKTLTRKDIQNKACLKPLEDVKLSAIQTVGSLLQQTVGTAGTVVATGAGVVGDTIVVGTGLAGTFYLCARDSIFCEDIMSGYVGLMEEADLLWSTKKAMKTSEKWRCPQVDHISEAFRKVSNCLYVQGEYVAAFEQLALIQENTVMSDCTSDLEREKVEELKAKLIYNVK